MSGGCGIPQNGASSITQPTSSPDQACSQIYFGISMNAISPPMALGLFDLGPKSISVSRHVTLQQPHYHGTDSGLEIQSPG